LVSAIKLYEKLITFNDQSQLDLLKMRRAVRELKAQLKSMDKLSDHREAALSVDPEALYDYPIYQSDSEAGNIESSKIIKPQDKKGKAQPQK
jgi:hypothetical protein